MDGSYEKGSSQQARAEAISAYRDFVMKLNTLISEGHYAELAPFIDYLNAEIERQRIALGQKPGNTGTEEDGEDTIPVKTVTFKFIGGRSESFPVEVGTVLIAPDNTEGYKWKPDVPEFMPATNKTFREVPIEDREATATFHFADHTEEEIRQIVGTALTAPENTPGYYWDPEVPEVMPEEDTQYYELPEEEEQQEPTLYTVRFMKGSELVAEQQYEAGAVIQAPAAPSGYEWEDYPYRMPAEDITVNAVRKNIPGGGGGSGFE